MKIFNVTMLSLFLLASGAASAQTNIKSTATFSELARTGFKVVSVILIPAEATPGANPKNPPLTVTLIKETSVAVCVINLGNFQAIGTDKWVDDASRCDVRNF